jgi:ADP-heptose:LPS heptosyltransferase
VQFVSLQVGAAAAELTTAAANVDVIDLGREVAGFSDTAAVISALDLVLCVDTAVAHLAGALGKSVWLLLPHPADWRWMEEREETPWYPTMRLFRQRDRGDWANVCGARRDRAAEGAVRWR